jgi:hypothetical protein
VPLFYLKYFLSANHSKYVPLLTNTCLDVLKVKSDPKVYNVIKTDINIICLRQRETENNILNIDYLRLGFVRVYVVDQVLVDVRKSMD